MKLDKIKIIIITLFVLVSSYIGLKSFYLSYYDIKSIDNFQTISDQLKNFDTITLTNNPLNEEEYLTFQNMKIKNDFKNFIQINDNITNDTLKLSLRSDDLSSSITTDSFMMGKGETYIKYLKSNPLLFSNDYENSKKFINTNLTKFLDKNNIKNDYDLFNYLINKDNFNNNIFTSLTDIQDKYALAYLTSIIIPKIEKITYLKGDYNGYLFKINQNLYEVSIQTDNDTRYIFTFIGSNYFNKNKIKELIQTIVIS